MPVPRRAAAALALAALLAGCRIDVAEAPDGYHRMPDGSVMADALGSAAAAGDHGGGGHHDHALPDPADFPRGVVPIRLVIPSLGVDAPVVAAAMTSSRIQGPPVATDVAWLEQTRRPGEIGPAVLGGVTRLSSVPGAFAAIEQLAADDEFVVVGEEGDQLVFRVADVRRQSVEHRDDIFRGGGATPEVRLVAWAAEGSGDDTDLVVSAFPMNPDV